MEIVWTVGQSPLFSVSRHFPIPKWPWDYGNLVNLEELQCIEFQTESFNRHPHAKSLNNWLLLTVPMTLISWYCLCGPPASSPPAPRREPFTSPILISRTLGSGWFKAAQKTLHVDMLFAGVLPCKYAAYACLEWFWQGRGPPARLSTHQLQGETNLGLRSNFWLSIL